MPSKPQSKQSKQPGQPKHDPERWKTAALAQPSDDLRLSVPLHVLLGESVDVSKFYKKYFASVEAKDGVPGRPGFDTILDERRGLTAATGDDLLDLREAVQKAQTAYLLTVSPKIAAPMARAQFLIGEMTATLDWLFDDGKEDERDAQLDAVTSTHANDPETADAAAAALDDYAALADHYRDELAGLGGFQVAHIDEARKVAAELRDRPATPVPLTKEGKDALAMRNRLAMVLSGLVGTVRGGARFAFRNHPEIVREGTSAFERRRRAASRRAAAKKAGAAAAEKKPAEAAAAEKAANAVTAEKKPA